MFKKMLRNGAGRIALFTFALLAPCVQNTVFGQALNMDGQSVADVVSAPFNSAPTTADVSVAQNAIANSTHDNGPIGKNLRLPAQVQLTPGGRFQQRKHPSPTWSRPSCHSSTTDPCSDCQEPTRKVFAIALN